MKISQRLITEAIIFSVSVGFLVSIFIFWGVSAKEILNRFLNANIWLIFAYVAISIVLALGVTYRWRIALSAYGVKLPFSTLFIFRLIGFAVSYVTPAAHVGGEPVRALLVGKQGIPYKVSFSAVIVDKLIEMMFNIGMFFIGALIILNTVQFPLAARAFILLLSIFLVSVASIFTYNIVKRKKVFVPLLRFLRFNRRKNWKKLAKDANDLELLIEHFYAHKRSHFRSLLLINSILWALMFIEYKVALLILGYNASLFGIFLFLTGVGIAYTIPVPAALGVLELGQLSAGKILGIASSIGLALAFLIRVRDLIWTFIGLILLGVFHLNLFKLHERSQAAAKKYNLEKLHLELRTVYEELAK